MKLQKIWINYKVEGEPSQRMWNIYHPHKAATIQMRRNGQPVEWSACKATVFSSWKGRCWNSWTIKLIEALAL